MSGGVSDYSAEHGEGEQETGEYNASMDPQLHSCHQRMLQTYNTVALLNIDLMQIKFK